MAGYESINQESMDKETSPLLPVANSHGGLAGGGAGGAIPWLRGERTEVGARVPFILAPAKSPWDPLPVCMRACVLLTVGLLIGYLIRPDATAMPNALHTGTGTGGADGAPGAPVFTVPAVSAVPAVPAVPVTPVPLLQGPVTPCSGSQCTPPKLPKLSGHPDNDHDHIHDNDHENGHGHGRDHAMPLTIPHKHINILPVVHVHAERAEQAENIMQTRAVACPLCSSTQCTAFDDMFNAYIHKWPFNQLRACERRSSVQRYVCSAGAVAGSCSSDPMHWPAAPSNECVACCDSSACWGQP